MKKQNLKQGGKLRIGDDWNAITITALSQQSPLKALAELVENAIDAQAAAFCAALENAEKLLECAIEEQRRAAEEQASREILRAIHRAFREALLALPAEEYDWFQIPEGKESTRSGTRRAGLGIGAADGETMAPDENRGARQKEFFDFPGPLYGVVISPASRTVNLEAPNALSLRFVDWVCRFLFELADMRVRGKLEIMNKYPREIGK